MKPLKYITNPESSAYMGMRRAQVREANKYNKAEVWMYEKLMANTNQNWNRNTIWGFRIFDLWCANLGIVVEVDGEKHDAKYDQYRDEYNFRRSAIVVLRVRNFNESDADKALKLIPLLGTWKDRREKLVPKTKRERKARIAPPAEADMLGKYLLSIYQNLSDYSI